MKRFLIPIFALCMLVACRQAITYEVGDLILEDPWARSALVERDNGSVFMIIRNTGAEDDVLLEVYSSASRFTDVREGLPITVEGDGIEVGEMVQLVPVGDLIIPAGEAVEMTPDNLEIALIDMREIFEQGQHITLTLVFERAGEVTIEAEVRLE